MLTTSSSVMLEAGGYGDTFNYLAFDQNTGELLGHGRKAIFALEQADLRAPDAPIEILDAGVAGEALWHSRTPLQLARSVLNRLEESWSSDTRTNSDPRPNASKRHVC